MIEYDEIAPDVAAPEAVMPEEPEPAANLREYRPYALDVEQAIENPALTDYAERVGLIGPQRDTAFVEMGQAFTGSLVDVARSTVGTLGEIGLISKRHERRIEEWQDVNQQYQVYEGAKPYSSWAGAAGYLGQVVGSMLPTILLGGVFGKLGAFAAGRAAAFYRTGTALAIQAQFMGDDIKFFRDEVGLPPTVAGFAGGMTAATKTALNLVFGVERKIGDVTANGMFLNSLKRIGGDAAKREALNATARQALMAKVLGNARPYFATLKDLGIEVGGEAFTEVSELFVDDLMRRQFAAGEFHSFSDYFDTAAAVVPSTLMFGMFGSYRQHRNQRMIDELTRPIDADKVALAAQRFGPETMQEFQKELEALRGDFLKLAQRDGGRIDEAGANAAADILGGMAVKSALMMDRHDGKAVNPKSYVEGFRVAIAQRELTADEFRRLQRMPQEQAMDLLYEWGIVDEVERQRKNSDAEDSRFVSEELRRDMQIVLDPEAVAAREERVRLGLKRLGITEGAEITVTEALEQAKREVSAEPEGKPREQMDELQRSKAEGERARLREARKARGKIYTGPIHRGAIDEARGQAVILKERATAKELEEAISNPAVVEVGGQLWVEQVSEGGGVVLVPSTESGRPKVGLADKKLITETLPAEVLSMGEKQQRLFFEAVGATDIDGLTSKEQDALEGKLRAIEERSLDQPGLSEQAREQLGRFYARRVAALNQEAADIKALGDEATKKQVNRLLAIPEELEQAKEELVRLEVIPPDADQAQIDEAIEARRFRRRVGVEEEAPVEPAPYRVKGLKLTPESEATENLSTAQSEVADAERRKSNKLAAEDIVRRQEAQFMSGGRAAEGVGRTVEGVYLAKQQVAVFFKNATGATILHEFFHHVQAQRLMPPKLQRAMDKTFGSEDDPNRRNELEAEAFTRWLTNGELPDGADPNLEQAFQAMHKIGAAFYGSISSEWDLPSAVKQEFDALFAGAEVTADQEAAGIATADALASDKSVDFMAIKKKNIGRFHAKLKRYAKHLNISEDEARGMLRQAGLPSRVYAKNDKSGEQTRDMTDQDFHDVELFFEDRLLSPSERRIKQEEAEALRKFGGPEQQAKARELRQVLASRPDNKEDMSARFGGWNQAKGLLGKIRRGVRYFLMKSAMIDNITRWLDGGVENGPFQKFIRPRIIQGEDARYELHKRVENIMEADLGADFNYTDLAKVVEVDGKQFLASELAGIYMHTKSGWGEQVEVRFPEINKTVRDEAVRYVESNPKIKKWVDANRKAMRMLYVEMSKTAKDLGYEVGDIGDFYLPFVSQDGYEQQQDWEMLLDHLNPYSSRESQGTPRPGQTKTRDWISDIGDSRVRQAKLNSIGRIELDMGKLTVGYIRSTANYAAKAKGVKEMIQVLSDPDLIQTAKNKGEEEWLRGLTKQVRSEMYPGGRDFHENPVQSGDRVLQHVRVAGTMMGLGWRVRSTVVQPLAVIHGWGAYARNWRDIHSSLSVFMGGMMHGGGWQAARKVFNREQLVGWEPYDQMVKDHPQVRYRAFDPDYETMQRSNLAIMNTKFGRHALDGMRMVDMIGVTALYTSAKQSQMLHNEAKVVRGEMTMEEAQADAKDFALRVIEKTQNPSNVSQRSLFQKESEFMKALNPFSGQRFVNFNYYMHDIVLPIFSEIRQARGVGGKTVAAAKAIAKKRREILFSSAVPAVLFGMLYRMRPPEDEKELFWDMVSYPLGSIPFAGQLAQSLVTGKFTTYAYDPTILGGLVRSAQNTAKTAIDAAGGDFDNIDYYDMTQVRRLATGLTGIPDYPVQVAANFVNEMGWGGKEEEQVFNRIMKVLAMPVEERE